MTRKVVNQANYVSHYSVLNIDRDSGEQIGDPVLFVPGKFFTQPSQTVPDMALSLSELLRRYTTRQSVDTLEGVWDADEMVPDNFERLDQVERVELIRKLKGITMDAQGRLQRRRELLAKAAAAPAAITDPVNAKDAPSGAGGETKP